MNPFFGAIRPFGLNPHVHSHAMRTRGASGYREPSEALLSRRYKLLRHQGRSAQFPFRPVVEMTFRHFSVSDCKNEPSSARVLPIGRMPCPSNRFCIAADFTARVISVFILSAMA